MAPLIMLVIATVLFRAIGWLGVEWTGAVGALGAPERLVDHVGRG